MRWVRQEDAQGCGLAVLAMLTGESYAAVKAEIEASKGTGHNGDWSEHGITHITLDNFLVARGWYMQRLYAWMLPAWPPEPWAYVHYAQVTQPSGNSHFVVVDADGAVFDPMEEGVRSLSDWPGVNNIVGLVPPSVLEDTGAYTLGFIRRPPVSLVVP